jgi:hypothetical protein
MDCSHCGALLQEGQRICPACGGAVRKPGFWRRLWQFFSSANATQVNVIRTAQVEKFTFIDGATGQEKACQSFDEVASQLQAKIKEAKASGQCQIFRLDEVPPELKKKFEEALASGKNPLLRPDEIPPEILSKLLEEAKSSGNLSFVPLNEIPAELRSQVEKAKALKQGTVKETFSFEGPDGQKHTYHSLEEMPPDIRAVFLENLPHSGDSASG